MLGIEITFIIIIITIIIIIVAILIHQNVNSKALMIVVCDASPKKSVSPPAL